MRRLLGPLLGGYLSSVFLAATATPLSATQPNAALATGSCCNIVELRQYTLRPGHREAFIELFDSTFADPLDATGLTVLGQFRDLDRPDRFVWIRGFQDMTSRAKELAAFYDSDLWHARRDEANASIEDSDNVLLLEPASPALRFKGIPPRPATAGPPARSGLVVVTLFYTKTDNPRAFEVSFEQPLRRHAEAAGARTLGAYVSSAQENNFPRLPIRIGEHVFVWVAQFAGLDAYAGYLEKLRADTKWTSRVWPAARDQLSRDPEVLRLTPTARSRIRG